MSDLGRGLHLRSSHAEHRMLTMCICQELCYYIPMSYKNIAVDPSTKERIKGLSECLDLSQAATIRILSHADVKVATMIQRRAWPSAARRNQPPVPDKAPLLQHPATVKRLQDAAGRWTALKRLHGNMERSLWLGVMVQNFSDDDLTLLGDFLSESDRALLKKAGRRVRRPRTRA